MKHIEKQITSDLENIAPIISRAMRLIGELSGLPQTGEQLGALLDELADAEEFSKGHWGRYPEAERVWDLQTTACHEDWHRCCVRKDYAISALTKFAMARKGVQS